MLIRSRHTIAVASVVLSSCSSTSMRSETTGATVVQRAAFLHAGFGAGPQLFTDESGHLLEERRSEPFGAPIGAADVAARDLNLLNKRTDAVTGWSDHGARWLVSTTGRWLSTDPPVTAPDAALLAAPWRLHPYQYVDQNPVVFWDPDGREPSATSGLSKTDRDRRLVDAAMSLVGRLTWVPSSPDPSDGGIRRTGTRLSDDRMTRGSLPNSFAYAVRGEEEFSSLGQGAAMNCWEFVMFSAQRAGVTDAAWIRDLHKAAGQGWTPYADAASVIHVWLTTIGVGLGLGAAQEWKQGTAIPAGNLVYFNGMKHVALSTGRQVNGHQQVVSLWTYPQRGAFDHPLSNSTVQLTTVEDLQGHKGLTNAPIHQGPNPW